MSLWDLLKLVGNGRERRGTGLSIFSTVKEPILSGLFIFLYFIHCVCLLATEEFLLSATVPQTKLKK